MSAGAFSRGGLQLVFDMYLLRLQKFVSIDWRFGALTEGVTRSVYLVRSTESSASKTVVCS